MASSRANSTDWVSESSQNLDDLVGRLHRAGANGARGIIEEFSLGARADLAAFCWQRTHLYEIGLAIAEHCDERSLSERLGITRGNVLFVQSRERKVRGDKALRSYRPKITLAGPAFY
jgi:hypothetical protein